MAQPSILVGTFSIFEYLILKQMYPNFKTIMSRITPGLNYIIILFLGDRNIYHVTMTSVLALTRISVPISIFGRYVHFGSLSAVGSFTKNL